MGNQISKINQPWENLFKFGKNISIKPEKENWFEGEEFKGILQFEVEDEKLPPCTVDIVLEGFENVYWIEQNEIKGEKTDMEHKESKKIVDLRFKILESKDGYKKGSY